MHCQRLWMVAALFVSACASSAGGGSGGGALTACTWPSSLDATDAASDGACHAERALVKCSLPGGVTAECLSDDPTSCPDSTGGSCADQCNKDEYAVSCGQVGPGPIGSPPAACRSMGAIPAGIVYYCCPCGS